MVDNNIFVGTISTSELFDFVGIKFSELVSVVQVPNRFSHALFQWRGLAL